MSAKPYGPNRAAEFAALPLSTGFDRGHQAADGWPSDPQAVVRVLEPESLSALDDRLPMVGLGVGGASTGLSALAPGVGPKDGDLRHRPGVWAALRLPARAGGSGVERHLGGARTSGFTGPRRASRRSPLRRSPPPPAALAPPVLTPVRVGAELNVWSRLLLTKGEPIIEGDSGRFTAGSHPPCSYFRAALTTLYLRGTAGPRAKRVLQPLPV